MDTNRLETFSDGVIAIAITLLILEIDVPEDTHGELWSALLRQWPSYLAYLISFAVIGIIWVNHHGILALVARVDRPLLYLNLLLLLAVAGIPFPTALVAEHLQSPGIDSEVAAAVYGGWATLVALSFNLMWRWIVHDESLIRDDIDIRALRANTRRFSLGLVIYPLTVGIAFLNPVLALGVHGLVAVYYVVDQFARGGARLDA
ncbi:MAG: TMEM175 family protein [Actinomycetota bacterium]